MCSTCRRLPPTYSPGARRDAAKCGSCRWHRRHRCVWLERPALGAAVLHFVSGEQPAQTSRFVYDGKTLTTPLLQVQLDELGRITSLVTRADGMQWADGPMNTLLMAEDVSAGWDGWDIDAD